MFKRLAMLTVLLMTLCGVIPAAVACMVPMPGKDCCPDGRPCEPATAPVAVSSVVATCCMVQPVPSPAVAAPSASIEHRIDPLPIADPSAAPAHEFHPPDLSRSRLAGPPAAVFQPPDQQQIYLRTARLRL